MKPTLTLLAALLLAPLAALHAAETSSQSAKPDIMLADFEKGYYFGPDNEKWTVEGEAFNHATTPVSGAKGFVGKGLADSWDAGGPPGMPLAGTLTSPVFTLESLGSVVSDRIKSYFQLF